VVSSVCTLNSYNRSVEFRFSRVSAIEKRDLFLGAYLEMQRNRRANEHGDRLATGGPDGSNEKKASRE